MPRSLPALAALLACLVGGTVLGEAARAQPSPPGARTLQAETTWAGPRPDYGPPAVRVVAEEPGAVTYEVTATWPGALGEALAADVRPEPLALRAALGYATASATVDLRAAVPPQVSVLAADYDEVSLPVAQRAALAEAFGGPAAEVVGAGEYRRTLTGIVRFRMLHVEGQTLRRYRRLVVVVRRAALRDAFLTTGGASDNPHLAVTRSVLADGTWFKIPIRREGIYRLDAAYLGGLGAGAVDLTRVQVYGNGGRPLPALNRAPRPADLTEVPTFVSGGALYFYAEAPNGWNWNAAQGRWEHFVNPFTRTTAYFVRIDGPAPRRVSGDAFPDWADARRLQTVEARLFHEEDLVNIERDGDGSGLDWLGPELTRTAAGVTVLDTIPPAMAGTARIRARVAARGSAASTITLSGAGRTLASALTSATSADLLASAREMSATMEAGRLALTFRATGGGTGAQAWLDWAEVVVPQAPRATGGYLRFATQGGEAGRLEYLLEGFTQAPEVWDVTTPGDIRRLPTQADGAGHRVQVDVPDARRPRELVAFVPSAPAVRTPPPAARVAPQNLHGLSGHPDYVVVAAPEFRAAAERLAEHRRTADSLRPLVVTTEQVFNEFGGGVSDMRAIRDFMRFLYDRAPSGQQPEYLLLFGDGHYDFRGIRGGVPNFVPTYQTAESFVNDRSFTSDDYFGLLGPDEGVWEYLGPSHISPERVDIGIGRLPVRSAGEAEFMVDKIVAYERAAARDPWRGRYTTVADDQFPQSWDRDLHVANIEAVAQLVESLRPEKTIQRIYTPSYPLVTTAAGNRRPQANEAIARAFDEGTLVWNYSGHGGPRALGDERYFTRELLDGLANTDRPAIMITATCSFGKFDTVGEQSLAEDALLARNGGAIALFTTVRLVYTSADPGTLNTGVNLALNEALLTPDAAGLPRRLGEALRLAKNTPAGAQGNNRKFNLLGDPAMRIGLPRQRVAVTRINGTDVAPAAGAPGEDAPAFRAHEVARVEGVVLGAADQPDPSFDGEVTVAVFDAERVVPLPPDACCNTGGRYRTRTDRLYTGRASVRQGRFALEFVVPQDVSYSGQAARVAVYAADAAGRDAFGHSLAARVAPDAGARPDDREGPRIRLFLDDTTFVDGGLARPDPVLIARLSDESGINTVGAGVGHELLLTVNGNAAQAVDVGRFYQGDVDTYRSGTVRYPLRRFEPGLHTLRLTAWDTANNSSTAELSFTVVASEALVVRNLYPYPNPTPGRTRFIFEHNQAPGTAARVQLRIYTLAGRPVRTLDGDDALPGGTLPAGLVQIPWDGLDDDLDPLASGVYLFRLRVETEQAGGGRAVAERIERLAIIR
ncbi:MAG: type IX secretion system sortase PorU [Rubricoccaceae bacterium]